MNKVLVKRRIQSAIQRFASAQSTRAYNLVPSTLADGKLYEAHILSHVVEMLHRREGLTIVLINSSLIPLKSSPGPINRLYPHFDLYRGQTKIAELWTDIEFLSLSYYISRSSHAPSYGDYHELDIVVVEPGASNRPRHDQILLGVECKNTTYGKNLLKEILGIRRELSLFHRGPRNTYFQTWPRVQVPADPPSCLLVYSTDSRIARYAPPGMTFGIDFFHEAI